MDFMFSESLSNVSNAVGNYIHKKAPEILAGAGICCFIATTIEAVKVTPKAVKLLEQKKKELETEDLPVKETVKTVGKLYLGPVVTGIAGTCFVIASVKDSNKRYLALSTSYKLVEEAARTYKEKVIETIGVRKEKQIRDSIAQDEVDKNPPQEKMIIMTNKGNTLFLESLSGQYFRGDINEVKRKAIELANRELNSHDNYVRLDEWLMDVSEGQVTTPLSLAKHGWSLLDQAKVVTVDLSAIVAHKFNDEPCLVLNYDPLPIDDTYLYYR